VTPGRSLSVQWRPAPANAKGKNRQKKKERNNPGRVAKPPEAEGRDKLEASPFRSRSSSASRSRTPRRKRKASIVKEKNQSSMTPSGNHSHGGEKKEAQESSEHRSRRRRSESIRNVDESCRGEIAATHLTFERSCGGPGDGWGGRRGRVLVVGSERREGLELGVVRLDWTPCVPGRQSVKLYLPEIAAHVKGAVSYHTASFRSSPPPYRPPSAFATCMQEGIYMDANCPPT